LFFFFYVSKVALGGVSIQCSKAAMLWVFPNSVWANLKYSRKRFVHLFSVQTSCLSVNNGERPLQIIYL